jgi:hypothetical protein
MTAAEKFVNEFKEFYVNASSYPEVVFNLALDKLYIKALSLDKKSIRENYIKAIRKNKEEQKKKAKQFKPIPTPDLKTFKINPGTLTGVAQVGKAIRKKKRKK